MNDKSSYRVSCCILILHYKPRLLLNCSSGSAAHQGERVGSHRERDEAVSDISDGEAEPERPACHRIEGLYLSNRCPVITGTGMEDIVMVGRIYSGCFKKKHGCMSLRQLHSLISAKNQFLVNIYMSNNNALERAVDKNKMPILKLTEP